MGATFAFSTVYLFLTLAALFLRKPPRSATPALDEELPNITIQIPTYNELAALNCAARCLAFDYPATRLQILIGDDSNDEDISRRIDAFASKNPRIRVCRRGNNVGFKPGNLNHMLEETSGDYILILDSDFLPEPDFLRRMVQPVVENPALAGVQAGWRIANTHQNITTIMGAGIINVIHIVILPMIKRFAHTGIFCGSGELVNKQLLIKNGGWTLGALTEDVDYSLRALNSGDQIVYMEDVLCECEVPHTARDLFRQQMRWAYGVMRAFMNHGWALLCSKAVHVRAKLAAICFSGGYIMVSLFILSLLFGFLNIAVSWGDPAPGSEPYTLFHLILDTISSTLLTCGMLISSLCASFIVGTSVRNLWKLLLASLTMGVILLFFVGKGLLKALLGLPMHWFMVRKNGNSTV
jgi:cellulose synthase/poly-beta-1,6-N-acetylglucosamine synthase-like glycosyltransferase